MPELDWEPALTVEWAAGFESWLLQFIWEICNDDSDDEVREVDKKPISIYLRYLTEPASFVLYLPYTPSSACLPNLGMYLPRGTHILLLFTYAEPTGFK